MTAQRKPVDLGYDHQTVLASYQTATSAEITDAIAVLETMKIDVRKHERMLALQAATEAAHEFGFSLNELTATASVANSSKKPTKSSAGEAKYRNPENPSQTWTGKGRQPNWYKTALANGKSAEDLLI